MASREYSGTRQALVARPKKKQRPDVHYCCVSLPPDHITAEEDVSGAASFLVSVSKNTNCRVKIQCLCRQITSKTAHNANEDVSGHEHVVDGEDVTPSRSKIPAQKSIKGRTDMKRRAYSGD